MALNPRERLAWDICPACNGLGFTHGCAQPAPLRPAGLPTQEQPAGVDYTVHFQGDLFYRRNGGHFPAHRASTGGVREATQEYPEAIQEILKEAGLD